MIIGGGLAGCEAAWQLLTRGHRVVLYEMKPLKFSPAHSSPHLAELVCSNSLRSNILENAVGLLKEEMRSLNSLIIAAADRTAVPAGKALAVDRIRFSLHIEEKLLSQEGFTVVREELQEIPGDITVIIATGPLTSDSLAGSITALTGSDLDIASRPQFFKNSFRCEWDRWSCRTRSPEKNSRYSQGYP